MDMKRIKLGLAAWFLGIIVPVSHHVILVTVALRREGQSTNIIYQLFEGLPWIDYVYLLAMAIVGAILIITGMKKPSQ
jgi:hypothetical protein